MKLLFTELAWEEYLYWQQTDKKMLKRINELIRDAMRQPFEGIGKPEPLRHKLAGCWSRPIDLEHRLVYKIESGVLYIVQCRFHYESGR